MYAIKLITQVKINQFDFLPYNNNFRTKFSHDSVNEYIFSLFVVNQSSFR